MLPVGSSQYSHHWRTLRLMYCSSIAVTLSRRRCSYANWRSSERCACLMSSFVTTAIVAERTRREVEHLLGTGLPSVRIVRNPVNMTDIAPILMPDVSDVRIASIGRLAINSKGQDILLGALGAPEFKDKVWKLSVYGGGPHLEHLKRLAHHYGIADRVEFRGYVDDIRAIWKEHQLLALSSRVESAPLVVVEAMLCARPCVVNNVGGVTEWITEPETGFVSEGQHIDSFRMALGRAWLRKCDWASIGTRARDIALKLIDPDPGSTLLEILLKVVRGE